MALIPPSSGRIVRFTKIAPPASGPQPHDTARTSDYAIRVRRWKIHGTQLPRLRNGPIPRSRAKTTATVICPWILPRRSMQDIAISIHIIHIIHIIHSIHSTHDIKARCSQISGESALPASDVHGQRLPWRSLPRRHHEVCFPDRGSTCHASVAPNT